MRTRVVTALAAASVAVAAPPFTVLNPADFVPFLNEDYAWAVANIPFFESSDSDLTTSYYFRWRVTKRHIVATGTPDYPYVITEFAPDVPWAGRNNTIPCAAGHHLAEARWLTDNGAVGDSYSSWWVSGLDDVRHNYYYWYAHALLQRAQVAGVTASLPLLSSVIPNATTITAAYFTAQLPTGGSAFDYTNDCVWNSPGNEGQERSASGPGCRTLVQSLLYGEAAAMAALCNITGNATCVATFTAQAQAFQRRVLRLWNANITAFDTLQSPQPSPPPSPPPPMPPNYALYTNASIFCCDQSACKDGHSTFLYEGVQTPAACAALCDAYPGGICHFVTVTDQDWCQAAEYCNSTNPFAGGQSFTFTRLPNATQQVQQQVQQQQTASPVAGVRELSSLTSPWFFGAVPPANASVYAGSWEAAFDPQGLFGPYGLRTLEARNPGYGCHPAFCCDWAGPSWPFETAKLLTAATNILQSPVLSPQIPALNRTGLYMLLQQYTAMHTASWEITDSANARANYTALNASGLFLSGLGEAWIAEAGCAENATWTDDATEGYWYLHSSYVDIVLTSVAGLMPRAATGTSDSGSSKPQLGVAPLQPSDATLSWWAVDGAVVNGRSIAVIWDIDGSRYGRGAGLKVYVDGVLAAQAGTTQGPPLFVDL